MDGIAIYREIAEAVYQQNISTVDLRFQKEWEGKSPDLILLFEQLYGRLEYKGDLFGKLLEVVFNAKANRSEKWRQRDRQKAQSKAWFADHRLVGMSMYTDRFAGQINDISDRLGYLQLLGVNLLHLMPLFESPPHESDGGYAVSNFRKIDAKFGDIEDLQVLTDLLKEKDMYLMLDIVLNHTSHHHEWAQKAIQGDAYFQNFFYFLDSKEEVDEYEASMPEVFPESAPGSFTYIPELQKWVMTVFHQYQWDLNYSNPLVLAAMLENIFFYANLGVDVLRLDAPAFIWKQKGTSCQNLPQAHQILQLIRVCTDLVAPGIALLGEAIVAPRDIMKYFGEGHSQGRECHFAYNATQMALQWDMLATGETQVMLEAQQVLGAKPPNASWITYTRCHDDIGLGYEDDSIRKAGKDPFLHRQYLKDYYSGTFQGSPAKGALFSVNPKTGDARISGSLASLCGLEKAIQEHDYPGVQTAIDKIMLMQAHSFFIGGLPMLFYGDEAGYTNDYSYLKDSSKNYDNRWMHRPIINWEKNKLAGLSGTIENQIFVKTQQLIKIRKAHQVFQDQSNIQWHYHLPNGVAGFERYLNDTVVHCLFNFTAESKIIQLESLFDDTTQFLDLWSNTVFQSTCPINMPSFSFLLLNSSKKMEDNAILE